MTRACPRCGSVVAGERLELCPRCLWDAELPPAVLAGAFELQDEIGRGGMASVYRARDLRLGRTVAVKLLPASRAADPDARQRFAREAHALALLDHPNIVHVYDVGEEDGQPFIVMEYVEGTSLAARLPLPEPEAIAVALQVCEALAYAHERGVVHRDIKPENILVEPGGRVKVADFGIARLVARDERGWTVTAPQQTAGTPHYLAPEVLRGAQPGPRADIYALGVVLYQMLSGQLPIGDFAPLRGQLDRIARRALAAEPERRYASAADMRRDLLALGEADAELPADERTWIYATALLQAFSTAVALWALLLSVTPKLLRPDEVMPLIMVPPQPLADGRLLSRARFETWPTLAAVVTFAMAITAYGLLRLHWRRNGLEQRQAQRPVREARWVLVWGVVACLVYAVDKAIEPRALLSSYVPIVGGVIEVVALFWVWVSILQAWRTGRALSREPLLWIGFALALVPPATELLSYVAASYS